MESDQLRRIAIISMSILCLSPVAFFSKKVFNKEEKQLVSYNSDFNPTLLNDYEIFNPNIKLTYEQIQKLIKNDKKEEKTEKENKLESKATNEKKVEKKTKTEEKTKKVSTSTSNKKTETSKKVESTANVVKKVEQPAPKVADVPANTNVASELVAYAKQFVGNPYRYGGTDLYNGIDCSGFTMKVYEHFGYSLPHASKSQVSYGRQVSLDALQLGDLIFYGYNGSVSHVAIYIGNGQIVHAATSDTGIKIANYNIMPIITVKRILN